MRFMAAHGSLRDAGPRIRAAAGHVYGGIQGERGGKGREERKRGWKRQERASDGREGQEEAGEREKGGEVVDEGGGRSRPERHAGGSAAGASSSSPRRSARLTLVARDMART